MNTKIYQMDIYVLKKKPFSQNILINAICLHAHIQAMRIIMSDNNYIQE